MSNRTTWQKLRHFTKHSTVVWKNLPVLPRVLTGYFRTLVFKQTVLRTIEFTITPDCNLSCEMCYATKLKRKNGQLLTPTDYKNIWQQAKKLGAFSVVISGGEPTVRKDLFEVIGALEPHRTIIGMVSNSSNLNENFMQKLRQSGVRVLHLSLNSVDSDVNDRERDFQGHFNRVNELIDIGHRLGMDICLSTVISHGELERMKKVVRFAKERNVGVSFSLACPTGKWEGARNHLLTPQEWQQVDQFMTDNPHVRSDWTINFSMKKECPGGREKLCVSPYGDIMGCGMNFISLGNVLHEPLAKIWERTKKWPPFQKRSQKCLIAVDQEYLEEYLLPVVGSDSLPVSVKNHPKHPMPLE